MVEKVVKRIKLVLLVIQLVILSKILQDLH